MITESLAIKGLQIISLALTPTQRWEAASASEVRLMVTLTVFALLTLFISVILLFWARAKYKCIAQLTATNEELHQEISKIKMKCA
jgi:cell division protein FtsB